MAHGKQIYEEKGFRERFHSLILLTQYTSERESTAAVRDWPGQVISSTSNPRRNSKSDYYG